MKSKWRPEVRKFYRKILKEYQLTIDGDEVLKMACDSYERYCQAKDLIDDEGLTLSNPSGMTRKHPAYEVEKVASRTFLQAIKQLGIEFDIPSGLKKHPGMHRG